MWAGFDPPIVDSFSLRPSPFQVHRNDPGDPDSLNNAVVSVLEDSRGILWAGRLSGLDRIDRRTGHITQYADTSVSGRLRFRTVHAIAEDREGYLWFGEWGNGLNRFDPRTGGVKFYIHDRTNPASLSSDIVESLYVDRRGTLWAGGYNALDRFDPKTEQFRAYRSPVPGSSQYRAIAEDAMGALWLASLGNGLHRFDPVTGRFTVYRKRADDLRSLSNDSVNTVYVDRAGTVWAGTSDGLCGLDPNAQTFTCYHSRDGLASSVVEGILEDERGTLWVSTSDGLSRFDPRTRTFRNYYAEDGLPSNEFRFAAASRTSGGEMFFGSTSGLLAFFPAHVIDDPSPPTVVLTDFWLFGNRLRAGQNPLRASASYTDSLTLGPRQNIFSVEFSALSYANPRRNRYFYRLEGLEERWNERDSSQRLATYTTLPPGDYVLRVTATNSRGVSNEAGTSVRIRILAPWWSTWWFRVVALAAGVALLSGLYRWRLHQLQRQEQQLRDVINTVPANVWSTSPDGAVDFVNERWRELTGLPLQDALGSSWEAVVHPDDRAEFMAQWRAAVRDGKPMEHEVRVRRADGEYRWLLVRNVPLRDQQGKIAKWYGTSIDIEDRKRAEEERERVRQLQTDLAHVNRVSTLGELTASIAHDVKQPIASAIINARTSLLWLAREQPDLQEARDAILRVVKDNTRGAEIIDRLRSLYMKEGPNERQVIDVNEVACEMLVLLRSEADRHSISMRTELADELPKTEGDRVQLQQVFMNLMLNGIEAMKDTCGELTITSERTSNGQLLISIRDTGVGLPAKHADQIFNALFTTKSYGTGMGLSISRTIVESHGGRLWASANAERGATFQFTLPAVSGEQAMCATGGGMPTAASADG
jgi:PAS domain S-box-containing protein